MDLAIRGKMFQMANDVSNIQKIDTKDKKRLREQTDGFESLMVKQYLEKALESEDSLYPKQAGSDIYKSMFVDEVSKKLVGSFGYSDLLFENLSKNL
jgi:Rod binding domain-containing protein